VEPKRARFWRGPWPWVAAATLLAAYATFQWSRTPDPSANLPPVGGVDQIAALARRSDVNVLFVLIDTLRADRLHAYGYKRPTSPFLDLLGAEGVRFARHMSQSSWTKCSMASLWTGLFPAHSGVTKFNDVLAHSARVPAEIFHDAGFRTAGLWRNGWVDGYHGFDQGFDVYTRPGVRPVPDRIRRQNPTVSYGGSDMDLVEEAMEFLRLEGKKRWFLYLHMMDVHEYTYDAESAQFGTSSSDVYDNAILHVDHTLDQLFGRLAAAGLLKNTLTVIVADHGEAHGERGFEGHARNVYPEVTTVPWFISFPFRLQPGIVIQSRTANVDLWPTILELMGLPAMEHTDGRSRVPEIMAAARGEAAPDRDATAIAHLDQTWGQRVTTSAPNVAIREGHFRYVQFRNAKGAIREQLYDADEDAHELDDRIAAEPAVAERMRGEVARYLESRPVWDGEAKPLELDELQLNQLRALGYAVP
jgi:arylsulfatase A-like enzyme